MCIYTQYLVHARKKNSPACKDEDTSRRQTGPQVAMHHPNVMLPSYDTVQFSNLLRNVLESKLCSDPSVSSSCA